MKKIALAALAVSALATPAFAGPYVESKHEFKGSDDDFKKQVHQGRVGYDWKVGPLKPYVEGGVGVTVPDGSDDNETFTALEAGTSVSINKQFSAYGKYENIFNEDNSRDWKVEMGTKYKF